MAHLDHVVTISRTYDKKCLFRRNRYLVDHSDLDLTVYDGCSSGTAMTVGYAHERGEKARRLGFDKPLH